MRYFIFLFVALCIHPSTLCASDQPKLSPAQQEVLKVSLARRDASNRRDMAALARFIADDCLFSTDDGLVILKTQYLEHMGKLPVEYDHSTNPRDFTVRLHGNTAVINFRTTAHERFGDTDIISEQRRTETWLKQHGSWLLIAIQAGNLPVNFRKPMAVDASVFKDYVGQYEWRPGDDVETVFLKDGRLWTQQGGDKDEYLPAGPDKFFINSDLGTFAFARNAQGVVTGYTYLRIDGQEIHVKKIKGAASAAK
jgi:ketosteroid isomerase-like protein